MAIGIGSPSQDAAPTDLPPRGSPSRRNVAILGAVTLSLLLLLLWLVQSIGAAPSSKPPRIGYLAVGLPDDTALARLKESFLLGLAEHGYEDRRNVIVEEHYAGGDPAKLSTLAGELVRSGVDIIVAADSAAIAPAREATSIIPIVMTIHSDPIRAGFVENLRRPGGNITGLSNLGAPLVSKRLELLTEIKPGAKRVAVLWHASPPGVRAQWEEALDVAPILGLELISLPITNPTEIQSAFERARAEGAEMLLVLPDPLTLTHRAGIVNLATAARLPDMYGARDMVDEGGLVSLAADRFAMTRRAANYVDRILKGEHPAYMPVEQPMLFELVVNLKTAHALDLNIPTSILITATDAVR
jgi:putative tryptophan/tyrosine transport system substrate-binding protein